MKKTYTHTTQMRIAPLILKSLKSLGLFLVLLAVLVTQVGTSFSPAAAQSGDEGWATPVNLSNSSAASDPILLMLPDGNLRVLWKDLFSGFMYTQNDGVDWTQPLPLGGPFEDYTPKMVLDSRGMVHAFWIDKNSTLFYSRVNAEQFSVPRSWLRPRTLSKFVLLFDVAVTLSPEGLDKVHVSYIQGLDANNAPAGVYYLNLDTVKMVWTTPAALYYSPYFRPLVPGATPDESEARASIKIATALALAEDSGEESATDDSAAVTEEPEGPVLIEGVFVVWDNPLRERVYIARSLTGGLEWDQPVEVDAPIDGTVTSGPGRILIHTQGANVLLIWQTNNTGMTCTQYYQWSYDAGQTWSSRERMLDNLPGCAETNNVLVGENGEVLLMITIQKQSYLLAWNGQQWSNPQPQRALTSFTDPVTFRSVDLGCRQSLIAPGGRLYLVGCDLAGGQDIWISNRMVGDVSRWFSAAPAWQSTTALVGGRVAGRPVAITPFFVGDASFVHAFWSESAPGLSIGTSQENAPGVTLYYARQSGGQWSPPEVIHQAAEGRVEAPAAAVNAAGKLFLVWSGGRSGEIFFSQVPVERALLPAAWSDPIQLPNPAPAGSSPSIVVDAANRVFVTYSIPLNEGRGIYVTYSDDDGQTWTDPIRVFDAAAAGWAKVDDSAIAVTESGSLHLLWTQYTLPGGAGSLGLYYARSEDRGRTWSQPMVVVDKPVLWSRIEAAGEYTVHRVWQELEGGRTTLWHEQSQDGGATWRRIAPVSIFGAASNTTVGEPSLVKDRAGRLHLLQFVSRGDNHYNLQHWVWDGERWVGEQNLDMGDNIAGALGSLTAGITGEGAMAVAFNAEMLDLESATPRAGFYFTARSLEIPSDGVDAEAPVAAPAGEAVESPALEVTPTVDNPGAAATQVALNETGEVTSSNGLAVQPNPVGAEGVAADPDRPSSNWLGTVVGPLAAGLIVLVVFIVGARSFGVRRR